MYSTRAAHVEKPRSPGRCSRSAAGGTKLWFGYSRQLQRPVADMHTPFGVGSLGVVEHSVATLAAVVVLPPPSPSPPPPPVSASTGTNAEGHLEKTALSVNYQV
jgi:hypothetical protein